MESESLRTPWMEEPQLSQQELPPLPITWTTTTNNNSNVGGTDPKNDDVPSFNSFLQDDDWFMNSTMNHDIGFTSNQNESFLIQPLGPSSSPPSSVHAPPSFTPTPFFNLTRNNNPFTNDFDFGSESSLLNSNSSVLMAFNKTNTDTLHLSSNPEFNPTRCAVELSGGFSNNTMSVVEEQFHGSNSLISNQTNVLQQQATEVPTLFQKRRAVALLQGSADKLGALEIRAATRLATMEEEMERKRKISEVVGAEEGLNDDSDDDDDDIDKSEGNGNYGGNSFNGNNINDDGNGGMQKGKKKAVPAKNLMAERRRRKKLNDRLYMLRSVVPKISKV